MTRTSRRILFYTLVAVFVLGSVWLVLIAKGFAFDIPSRTIEERGAIFLRVTPAGARIYLDGTAYEAPAGIRQMRIFMTNILPGIHHVVIDKEGYHRWEKRLVVTPLNVAEQNTIRLFARAPEITAFPETRIPFLRITEEARRRLPERASSTLASLGFAEDKDRQILLAPDDIKALIRSAHELLVVWMGPERVNRKRERGDREIIMRTKETITDALWLPGDAHHLIFAAGGKIKIAELDGRGGRNTIDLLEADNVQLFIDDADGTLVYSANGKFFKLAL